VVIITLLFTARSDQHGHFPFSHYYPTVLSSQVTTRRRTSWRRSRRVAFASRSSPVGSRARRGVNSVLEAVFLLLNVAVIAGFLVCLVLHSTAHLPRADQHRVSRRPRALGGLDKTRTWTWRT